MLMLKNAPSAVTISIIALLPGLKCREGRPEGIGYKLRENERQHDHIPLLIGGDESSASFRDDVKIRGNGFVR